MNNNLWDNGHAPQKDATAPAPGPLEIEKLEINTITAAQFSPSRDN